MESLVKSQENMLTLMNIQLNFKFKWKFSSFQSSLFISVSDVAWYFYSSIRKQIWLRLKHETAFLLTKTVILMASPPRYLIDTYLSCARHKPYHQNRILGSVWHATCCASHHITSHCHEAERLNDRRDMVILQPNGTFVIENRHFIHSQFVRMHTQTRAHVTWMRKCWA